MSLQGRVRANRRRTSAGSVFIDALMAVFVLSLGAAAFFSLLPMLDRSQKLAKDQSLALQMANRMIDQIQMLKPAQITANTLTQLQLIDSGQANSPFSFSHVPLDDSTNYSPAQALNNGKGIMTVTNVDNGSVMVNVEIDWTSASGKKGTIITGTIVGGYR